MDNGAIVHIEYDLYNAESGDLIETTREEIAKEHEVFDEARTYEPTITVVGEGRLIAGFEAHLLMLRQTKSTPSISSQPMHMESAMHLLLRLSHRMFYFAVFVTQTCLQ